MNLIEHAKQELDLIGMTETGDVMNAAMRKHILHMVEEFSAEGHSGFSASYAVNILKDLLTFKSLSPLTGADDEWVEVGDGVFQNRRCSRVFKQADRFQGQAYDIDGIVFREKNGVCFTSWKSVVVVTFPYTPKTEYVNYTLWGRLRAWFIRLRGR